LNEVYEKNADQYIAVWETDLPKAPLFRFC
jgi:hypothetical protein